MSAAGLYHLGVGWQALPALADEIGAPYPEVWSLAHVRREPYGYLGLGEADKEGV